MFSPISIVEKISFTKHMLVMLKAGIPISEALQILIDQTPNKGFKKILKNIEEELIKGKTLSKAIEKQPNLFDQLYISLLEIGEKSGTLEKNLEYLATKLSKDYSFKQKVTSASMYPLIILITAFLVGMQISLFVLPKLVDLFESMDTNLPISTKLLIDFSNLMKNYGFAIFGGFFLLIIIFWSLLFIEKVRYQWQILLMRLTGVGTFIVNVETANFCRNLGIMVKSGIPLMSSWDILEKSTNNLIFKEYVRDLKKGVSTGKPISSTILDKKFKFFPIIGSKMIRVGEKTGNLDESLLYLGDFFEGEVDNASKNLSSILEPVLLFVIGMVVAFMAVAIISPIYQFTSSVQQ